MWRDSNYNGTGATDHERCIRMNPKRSAMTTNGSSKRKNVYIFFSIIQDFILITSAFPTGAAEQVPRALIRVLIHAFFRYNHHTYRPSQITNHKSQIEATHNPHVCPPRPCKFVIAK